MNPIRSFFDPRLLDFDVIYAAAGTPRHIFPVTPADLLRLSGAQTADFVNDSSGADNETQILKH